MSAIQHTVNHWFYITVNKIVQIVIEIPRVYNHFPWLTMTDVIFSDFPSLEIILLSSMTFHERRIPRDIHTRRYWWHYHLNDCTTLPKKMSRTVTFVIKCWQSRRKIGAKLAPLQLPKQYLAARFCPNFASALSSFDRQYYGPRHFLGRVMRTLAKSVPILNGIIPSPTPIYSGISTQQLNSPTMSENTPWLPQTRQLWF